MTVIEKTQAWPASLPHLVTEVPGPKALAQVAADQAVVSNSLPRAYPFAPVRGWERLPRLLRRYRRELHRPLPSARC
jgi:hypothetical protein